MKVAEDIAINNEKESNKKWGTKAMSLGYVQFPALLLTRQRELGLDAVDMNIVLQMIACWWRSDDLPFPSKRKIADALGIHPSTVQRRIAAMENVGLIKRVRRDSKDNQGQMSNKYDLSGLVKRLEPIVSEEAKKREAQQTKKGRKSLKIVEAPQSQ